LENNKKYNIGLDIGTTSVGWAVVECENQKIIRKGNKALWGVRLFEEANTAADRRNKRSTRRRYDRRRERIRLLQEEFKEEINKIDSNFFTKLKESFYHEDDKENKTIPLTKEEKETIKEYNNKYKTIYHLRNKLINSTEKEDIRLVYLAIHHIIKYRGNFLYNSDNFSVENLNLETQIETILNSAINFCPSLECPTDYKEYIKINDLSIALLDSSKNDRKVKVQKILESILPKIFVSEFIKLINGNKFNIIKMIGLENIDKLEISFNGTDYEEKYNELESILGDSIEVLDSMKQLYDMVFLKRLFKSSESTNISALMVEKYELHKKDLKFLKSILDIDRKIYNKIFKSRKEICPYENYIKNKITNEEFVKEIKKYLPSIFEKNINQELLTYYEANIQKRMENGDFLPRITDKDNGKYPYQLNKEELIKIIENQGKYYPFLLDKTKDDTYKLVKLLEFRIPYYVGPLTEESHSKFAWMIRKNYNEKITPYNFDDIIDKEATAEKFIKRMISHCTYLLEEPAMPNNSILYSKYKVMNELKQIRINGKKMSCDMQNKILRNLFMTTSGNITDKKFKEYLYANKDFDMYQGDFNITGYSADGKFANTMQSYIDFFGENGIFSNTNYTLEEAEQIIEWITIFEDKDILKTKVERDYPLLNDSQIKKIISKKYSGWGSLCKKLLTTKYYVDKESGVTKSIIDLMEETENNFMQIINDDTYNFQKMIKENNKIDVTQKLNYSVVECLATSPSTKRGIYQALRVVDEIVKYMKKEPEAIMVEMARGDDQKKRKDDRKKYLIKLYEKAKEEIEDYNQLMQQLGKFEKIDSQKLFLYFIQEGKSLYSGKPLNIEDLATYEIDHIIPRTLIKDDSIDNKALVYREENQTKAANYILPREFRSQFNRAWWEHLRKIGLISSKKFHNLIRSEYKEEEIENFINRQLVETRQITKHVANILNSYYKNTQVVYLHADLSHNYREKFELFKFRDINDYHHAHDAYLAAVLGEYKEKYLKCKVNFEMLKELNKSLIEQKDYKKLKYGYVINSLDSSMNDVMKEVVSIHFDEKTGEVLFDAEEFNRRVEDTLYRNDILISRKPEIKTGQLYKETIYSHNDAKIKSGIKISKTLPVEKYGFYTNIEYSYLVLVKVKEKNYMFGIPIMYDNKIDKAKYIEEKLKVSIDDYEIICDRIPFYTKINYHGHLAYLTGSIEFWNAYQLKISKKSMKKWKYMLNFALNDKKIPVIDNQEVLTEQEVNKQMLEFIKYLLSLHELFPLYNNTFKKLEKIDIENLDMEKKKILIKELLKMLSASSMNANLKEFGLTDREGRVHKSNIGEGTLIYNSITGIREKTIVIEGKRK